ncbi:MAG: hypothetical protein M3409_10740 [Gemmatimonadota bacterium]|jgi:hypothetical protein|nr:hypothetical protein [Gemmatimonadota bacterium]
MRDIDLEIGLRRESDRGEQEEARRLGERILYVDELEDTLGMLRSTAGTEPERIRRLERNVDAEKEKLQRMEERGWLDYEAMDRAMRDRDLTG